TTAWSTTTLPGEETTVWSETTAWSTTTLPGEETTIWSETTAWITTTLPGEVTTLPPSTTTISGTTVTIPGSITTLPGSTITLPASTVQLPGSTVIYTSTVSGPSSIETVVVTQVISTTIVNEIPGPATTLTLTSTAVQTLPPVTVTATATVTTATISVCPSLTINPTYTPPGPLPTDYTWGCPPGYLCRPKHLDVVGGCNIEAGLPAETYYCSPDECIEAPPLYDENQYWGEPVISEEVGTYNVSKYYFNCNPERFGLNYSIFRFPEKDHGVEYFKRSFLDVGIGKMFSKLLPRQELLQDVLFSDVCYDECNGAALEAERRGKTPSLCEATSAFMDKLDQCRRCNERFPVDDDEEDPQVIPPDLNQWLGYCDGLGNEQTSTREPITTQTSSESTSSTRTSAVDPTSTGGDEDDHSTSATDSTTVTGTSSPSSTSSGDDATSTDSTSSSSVDDEESSSTVTGSQTESDSDATSTSSSTSTSGAGGSGSEDDDDNNDDGSSDSGSQTYSGTPGPSGSPTSDGGGSGGGSGGSSAPTPGSTPGSPTSVSPTGSSSPSPSPPVFTGAAARFGVPVHLGLIPVVLGLAL
ncbi:hypothetical protein BDW71DRAFT_212026, partial [Aspergillus fruticulosus]